MDTTRGMFAAVATPIHQDGTLDGRAFDRLVGFLTGAGVDGLCIGGATGEYPHFETSERTAVIRRAAALIPAGQALLVGVGSSSMRRVYELGEAAVAAGSRALLLPMPMFFRYEQDDLRAFCAETSRALRAPCLLYDLPSFTNGLAPETVLALLRDEEFIVGIKDSGGRVANLAAFESARQAPRGPAAGGAVKPWTLLVGDDALLNRGLHAG
ncbi:MAG: dihydrodipicolinate synthase family protein, partial [Acidobacteriota bacterium]